MRNRQQQRCGFTPVVAHPPRRRIGVAFVPGLLALLVLAGCSGKPDEDDGPVPPPPLPSLVGPRLPPAAIPVGQMLEVPVGGGNQALVLAAGGTVEGAFDAPRAGALLALGVQLGTYFDSSTGLLRLELCARAGCSAASADLLTSSDNAPLMLVLEQPLQVVAQEPVEYRLTKDGGDVDVVVWTYPAVDGSARIRSAPGEPQARRSPRLSTLFAPP